MRRITFAIAIGLSAVLAGCQGGDASHNRTTASPDGASIVRPTPAPTPTPSTEPSSRSIMQPSVAPEPTPTPTPPQPLDLTIHFAHGTRLDDAAKAALDALLTQPVVATGGPIVLRGSSDSQGTDTANRITSRKRAEAVATYLAGKGIARDRLTVIALGDGRPVAPNVNLDGSDNPDGRAANRRVDIHVDPGQTATVPAEAAGEPGKAAAEPSAANSSAAQP